MAAAGLWAAVAAAQPPPGLRGRPFMDDGAMRAVGALLHVDGLSDEQRDQLHGTMESGRAAVEPLLDQLHTANESLVEQLLAADAPSSDTLNGLVERVAELRRQLAQQQLQTVLSLREVFTADQLQQAAQHALQLGDGRDGVFCEKR
jgi:Spy/CpxP family protein refolding chaperone